MAYIVITARNGPAGQLKYGANAYQDEPAMARHVEKLVASAKPPKTVKVLDEPSNQIVMHLDLRANREAAKQCSGS